MPEEREDSRAEVIDGEPSPPLEDNSKQTDEYSLKEPEEQEGEFLLPPKLAEATDSGREKGKPGQAGEDGAFPSDLLADAADVGLTEEDLAAIGDEQAARRAVSALEKKIVNMGKTMPEAEGGEDEIPPDVKRKETKQTAAAVDDGDFKLKVSEEEFDPAIVADMKGIVNLLNDQRKAVRGLVMAVGAMMESREAAESAAFDQDIDKAIGDLGQDWKETFGDKAYSELDRAARTKHEGYTKLMREMLVIVQGRAKAGLPELGVDRLVKKALPLAFPDKVKDSVRREISDKLKKREGQITRRPASKKGGDVHGEDVAVRNLAARMSEEGWTE